MFSILQKDSLQVAISIQLQSPNICLHYVDREPSNIEELIMFFKLSIVMIDILFSIQGSTTDL